MLELLWQIGALAGAVAGCAHAVDIYRRCDRAVVGGRLHGRVRAAYHALWTLALWILFGAYVLAIGVVGTVLYVAAGRPAPPANRTPTGDAR